MGAQAIVQIANVISGFLLVRSMPKTEYAWFTIAAGAMATISVLADSGLGSAFTSIGGKTYLDKNVFASFARLIRQKRLQFLATASLVAIPIAVWALIGNDASVTSTVVLSVMILVAAVPATDAVVLMTVNKLFGRIKNIVIADLSHSLVKLGLVITIAFVGLSAITAVACSLFAAWVQIAVLRRQTRDVLSASNVNVDAYRPQIRQTVTHMMPMCVFATIQAQLSTYVLTIFAGVSQIADLGALSRVAVIFSFLLVPLQQIFLPAIARQQEPRALKKIALYIFTGFLGIAFIAVTATHLFKDQILILLGDQYVGLGKELLYFLTSSLIGFASNVAWGIALSRSWVRHGWIGIPISIALQMMGLPFLDLSKVTDVILLTTLSQIGSLLVAAIIIARGYQTEFSKPTPPTKLSEVKPCS